MNGPVTGPEPRRVRARVRASSREAYRDAIFVAATEVFGRVGYQAAKISDIAEAAGVAIGTVYNYFGSKEAAFASIVDQGREELFERLGQIPSDCAGVERLRAILAMVFETIEGQRALFKVYLEETGMQTLGSPKSDPNAENARTTFTEFIREAIEDAAQRGELRTDVPAHELTLLLCGVLGTFIATKFGLPPDPSWQVQLTADRIVDLFLQGAKAP